jgi:hypothetical protein
MSLVLAVPAFATTEINLGAGHPLWGTHTNDDTNHFDGGWLVFASIDKQVEARKWLRYGLMYNYTRIKVGIEEETTETTVDEGCWDGDYQYECYRPTTLNGYNGHVEATTTVETSHDWLSIHVLGPYAKPTFQVTKSLKLFAMIGAGLMYVDGQIYGDELGAAGFASAGVTYDIYKNFGITGQMLYVQGFTSHVDEIKYYAPVLSFKYSF